MTEYSIGDLLALAGPFKDYGSWDAPLASFVRFDTFTGSFLGTINTVTHHQPSSTTATLLNCSIM